MNVNKSEIMRNILGVVATAGIVTVAIIAPKALQLLGGRHQSLRRYNGYKLKRSLLTMQSRKLVEIKEKNSKLEISLTKEGQEKLIAMQLDDLKIIPLKIWDKKWRLVIFDIPEKFKQHRKVFQEKLRELGFIMMQKSVWVCPHPCLDQIEFLKNIYEIRPFVRVVTAEDIDVKHDLIKRFNLI